MNIKVLRIIAILMLVLMLLVLGKIIAGAVAKSNLANHHPAPGQLIDVGGYKLHIHCTGQGSPAVILEAGWGDYSATWAYVQPEIAGTTRVCSYDRAGYGWSETSPYPRTAGKMAEELRALLVNANIQGPYVLVGHSLGGMLVRVYAHNYPDDVVGIVLLDSVHEEQYNRLPGAMNTIAVGVRQFRLLSLLSSSGLMALAPQSIPNQGFPDELFAEYKVIWATTGYFKTAAAELSAMEENTADVRALGITSFGNLPLSVLSAGLYEPNSSLSEAENQQYWEEWKAMQSELVTLSSRGKQITAEQSGHGIQFDQPDLVIDAIREIVGETRK